MQIRHLLLVLMIMMIFGSAYPVGKLTLNTSLPPLLFASIRMGIVFLCLLPFCKIKLIDSKSILPLLGFALCMGVGVFMFMNLALKHSDSVSAIIIGTQLSVPFGILISSYWLKERFSRQKWFWIFGACAGIAIVGFDPDTMNNNLGLFFVAIMSFFYAYANVISRYINHLPVTTINAVMGLAGAVILFPLSIVFEGDFITHITEMSWDTWLLIFHSALIISLIAHQSMFYLYKFYPVGQVLPFYSLFPIFGLIQTFIIFNEVPTLLFYIGTAIVLGSVFMLNKKKNFLAKN